MPGTHLFLLSANLLPKRVNWSTGGSWCLITQASRTIGADLLAPTSKVTSHSHNSSSLSFDASTLLNFHSQFSTFDAQVTDEREKWQPSNTMSSGPFLPLSSPPDSPLLPRRPSLEPERDILTPRGQRIWSLLPTRNSTATLHDLQEETNSPTFLRRGSRLIGHSNPRYDWCVTSTFVSPAHDQLISIDTMSIARGNSDKLNKTNWVYPLRS